MNKITLPFLDFVFIDEKSDNLDINMEEPIEKTISFEGYDSYGSMIECDDKIYFYYRKLNTKKFSNPYKYETTHVAISTDNGLTFKGDDQIFKKPGISHNFCIINKLIDNNFCGIGGVHSSACSGRGIFKLTSSDNINWEVELIRSKDNSLKQNYSTHFDSMNNIVYDKINDEYLLYARYNKSSGDRRIQMCKSKDLSEWCPFKTCYFEYKNTNLYIPAVLQYPNSFLFVSFSNHQRSHEKKTNKVFLSYSLDGNLFKTVNKLLIQNQKLPHRPVPNIILNNDFFNIYIDCFTENKLKCYQYRKDGFSSVVTSSDNEEYFTLYSMNLINYDIDINFKTNEDGYVKILLCDDNNEVIKISDKLSGDHINFDVWNKKKESENIKENIKIKIILKKCKIYSISLHTDPKKLRDIIINKNEKRTNEIMEIIKKESISIKPIKPIKPIKSTKPTNSRKPRKRKTLPETLNIVSNIPCDDLIYIPENTLKICEGIEFIYRDLSGSNNVNMKYNIDKIEYTKIIGDAKYSGYTVDTKVNKKFNDKNCGRTVKYNMQTSNNKIIEITLIYNSKLNLTVDDLKILDDNKISFIFTRYDLHNS